MTHTRLVPHSTSIRFYTMASGDRNYEKIQEITECPICMEVYVKPQKLPCDHTFCADCLEPLKQGSRIPCPICRGVHDVTGIKSDFRAQQLIDALKSTAAVVITGTTGNVYVVCRHMTISNFQYMHVISAYVYAFVHSGILCAWDTIPKQNNTTMKTTANHRGVIIAMCTL